jgi:hypothetical protein
MMRVNIPLTPALLSSIIKIKPESSTQCLLMSIHTRIQHAFIPHIKCKASELAA